MPLKLLRLLPILLWLSGLPGLQAGVFNQQAFDQDALDKAVANLQSSGYLCKKPSEWGMSAADLPNETYVINSLQEMGTVWSRKTCDERIPYGDRPYEKFVKFTGGGSIMSLASVNAAISTAASNSSAATQDFSAPLPSQQQNELCGSTNDLPVARAISAKLWCIKQ